MAEIAEVTTREELERLLAAGDRPLLLFKHSTRCPVSARAHEEFRRFAAALPEGRARLARILVVEHRDVSDLAALLTGVGHESPQALLVVGGRPVWEASHGAVDRSTLERALVQAA